MPRKHPATPVAMPQAAELDVVAPSGWRPGDSAIRAMARLLLSIAERERSLNLPVPAAEAGEDAGLENSEAPGHLAVPGGC
jgi:hypothetical protein